MIRILLLCVSGLFLVQDLIPIAAQESASPPAKVGVSTLPDATAHPDSASPERMRAVVEHLASDDFTGRAGADAFRAGQWVADELATLGVEPLFENEGEATYFQPIPNGDGLIIGTNVAGVLPGSDPLRRDEFVFVTGHHDHLGTAPGGAIYHGANDNASAVAMVLEVARVFAIDRPACSVVLVSFDLEEHMLWGSRYFVANSPLPLDQIRLFITADMIGRPLGDLPFDEVFVMGTETAAPLAGLLTRHSQAVGQPVLPLSASIVGTRSDYGPFRNERVPFLFFSTGENPDYHTPRDVPERMDFELAAAITNLIVGVTRELANEKMPVVWQKEQPIGVSDAQTLRRVCSVVQAEADAGRLKLGVVEQLLVTQTLDQASGIIERDAITASEQTWLKRAAQGLLLTLF